MSYKNPNLLNHYTKLRLSIVLLTFITLNQGFADNVEINSSNKTVDLLDNSPSKDSITEKEAVFEDSLNPIPFKLLNNSFLLNWYFDTTYQYSLNQQKIPTAEPAPKIAQQSFINHYLHLNWGLSVTEPQKSNSSSKFGYRYHQIWLSPHDRMQKYLKKATDLGGFAFRPDLMERIHQFFYSYQYQFSPLFTYNLHLSHEFRSGGTTLFNSKSRDYTKKWEGIHRHNKIIPSVGIFLGEYGTLLPYLYLKKQINYRDSEKTFRSYEMGKNFALSYGLRHRIQILENKIRLEHELFHFNYQFNNYLMDFSRIGVFSKAIYDFNSNLQLEVLGSFSSDRFIQQQLIVNSCNFPDGTGSTNEIVLCDRKDKNLFISFGGTYNFGKKHSVRGIYSKINSRSDSTEINDVGETQYIFSYRYNIDSFHRSGQFTDDTINSIYGKKAFTYDQPQ